MTASAIDRIQFDQEVADEEQIDGYKSDLPKYELFAEVLNIVLSRAVKNLGILAIVQTRAKGVPNFAEKMIRKREQYPDAVNQLTDLCGARIIVDYQDEIEPVCEFIRRHFELHEAEDLLERLSVAEFGYRSFHFIVSLKPGALDDILHEEKDRDIIKSLKLLYERRALPPGPKYKAEIQVRTLLQHAWASFYHDRLYKGAVDPPSRWKRDANRIAATLEEADDAIARTVRGVDNYKTYHGAYMSREVREAELHKLGAVFRHDGENMRLAHQIARLALSLEDFQRAEERLDPFVSKWEESSKGKTTKSAWEVIRYPAIPEEQNQDEIEQSNFKLESIKDPEMAGVLLDYGWSKWKRKDTIGRECIGWAIALDGKNVDAQIALAQTYEGKEALECYKKAFETAPSDPRALGGFVQAKILEERSLDFLSIIGPSLEEGIKTCRGRAEVGVYLPHAYYDIGMFALLLGRPYESLSAYCKAIQKAPESNEIETALDRVKALQEKAPGQKDIQFEWIKRLLVLAKVAKLWQAGTIAENEKNAKLKKSEALEEDLPALQQKPDSEQDQEITQKAKAKQAEERSEFEKVEEATKVVRKKAETVATECLAGMIVQDLRPVERPVVIVAGGCDKKVEDRILEYQTLFNKAFEGFQGTIFSGGTTAGISGIVGDLDPPKEGRIRKVAYLPEYLSDETEIHEAYKENLYKTRGIGFSALEPLQNWIDLLASGINPADVKLLGINGGKVAAFEFRLAVALGAKAGIIADSGRAATEIFEDLDWIDVPGLSGLLRLPNDTHTVKVFLQGVTPSENLVEIREKLAINMHNKSWKDKEKGYIKDDPSMAEWEDLIPDFQYSLLDQADHHEEKLRATGFEIRKVAGKDVTPIDFSTGEMKEKVEIMAEMEHARWNAERLMRGWTLDPEKDVKKKKSPHLISWADLPDNIKEYDRKYVRKIPKVLAEFGYEIVPSAT